LPRRKIDTTTEHRISLGSFERTALQEAFSIQKENQRLDAITATAQAVGTAVGGLGIAGAALIVGAYLIPDWLAKTTEKFTGAGGWLDKFTDIILPSTPIAYRRAAQELAKRRGEIWRDIDSFCTITADTYDRQACSLAHEEKRALSEAEDLFIAQLTADNITRNTAFWDFIFYGLGDLPDKIDPKTEGRKEAEEVLRQQPTTTWDFITEGFRLGLDVVL
jgi:hypothetical protein